jgi:hypothetical protein
MESGTWVMKRPGTSGEFQSDYMEGEEIQTFLATCERRQEEDTVEELRLGCN